MTGRRIFISSTYTDLLDYRQAASEAIRGLDLQADDMVLWAADDQSAPLYSVDRVKQADAMVLLVAHRYGSIPDDGQQSVSELEYGVAREAGIPVFAFFVDGEVPWPPQHVEVERRELLDKFKARIEREVTRKYFRSPQELAFQVTQSLARFISRPVAPRPPTRFLGKVRPVSTPSRLRSEPDVLVPIGTAEDDLPLLLEVSRSRDLSGPLRQLREAVSAPFRPAPDELLETFRNSLTDYATQSWASQDLRPVRLRRGETRSLYVTPFTLSRPFTSVLSGFLGTQWNEEGEMDMTTVRGAFRPGTAALRLASDQGSVRRLAGSTPHELQSTGGLNRFLAIDPEDGCTYSVGWYQGELVEWRPFLCESVVAALPDTLLNIGHLMGHSTFQCPVESASQFLMEKLGSRITTPDGRFGTASWLTTERQAIMRVLAEVADKLAALHANGVVHGDVKPDNVLIVKSGVTLIDSFDVPIGDRSPGWTPNWSAPEQVRGEPVTPAADIYPLAVMAVHILGGEIVGEVRKYLTPRSLPAPREVDLFHSPSLYINQDRSPISRRGLVAWRDLIERALSFDLERRQGSVAEFANALREITEQYPLSGRHQLRPTGQLIAARLIDGSEAIARVVADEPVVKLA